MGGRRALIAVRVGVDQQQGGQHRQHVQAFLAQPHHPFGAQDARHDGHGQRGVDVRAGQGVAEQGQIDGQLQAQPVAVQDGGQGHIPQQQQQSPAQGQRLLKKALAQNEQYQLQ